MDPSAAARGRGRRRRVLMSSSRRRVLLLSPHRSGLLYRTTLLLLLSVTVLICGYATIPQIMAQTDESEPSSSVLHDTEESKFDDGFLYKIQSLVKEHERISDGATGAAAKDVSYYNVVIVVNRGNGDNTSQDADETARKNKLYIKQRLEDIGSKDILVAKSLSFVTASVPITKISDLAKYDLVYKLGDGELTMSSNLDGARVTVHATPTELSQNGLVLNGSGVTVAVIDFGGINHFSLNDKIIGRALCFSGSCTVASENSNGDIDHGTQVTQVIASSGLPKHNGFAPGVDLLDATMDGSVSSSTHALDWALTNGADVVNNSYGGGSCTYNISTRDIIMNEAIDKGMVSVTSAGNEYEYRSITNPGCSHNVITVGAINDNIPDDIVMASLSSRGPITNDTPRLKPEIVAPGSGIFLLRTGNNETSTSMSAISGTSFSGPQVSAAAALLLQSKPDMTPVEVKAAILLGADWQGPVPCTSVQYEQNNVNDNCSYARQPFDSAERNNAASLEILNNVGFGILNVNQTIKYTSEKTLDSTHVLGGYLDPINNSKNYQFVVSDTTEPVKVILSWFVYTHGSIPDQIYSDSTVVNIADLGFIVTSPSGDDIIHATSDYQTNEFAVFMPPEIGTYTVTVSGTGLDSIVKPIQSYALASTLQLDPVYSTSANTPPTTQNTTIIINPLQITESIPIILHGEDLDDDLVSFSVSRDPSHGMVSNAEFITNKISRILYTASPSFTTSDTFEITPYDGLVAGTPSIITITPDTPPHMHSEVSPYSGNIRHWDTLEVTSKMVGSKYSQTFSGPVYPVSAIHVGSVNMDGVLLNITTATGDEYVVAVPSSGARMLELESPITISSVTLSAAGIDDTATTYSSNPNQEPTISRVLIGGTFYDIDDIRMFVGYIPDHCSSELWITSFTCLSSQTYTVSNTLDEDIPDNTGTQSTNSTITIPIHGILESMSVSVDIGHTETSDIQVTLVSPQGDQIVLHDITGGDIPNISTTYSSMNHTGLASLDRILINGDWTLSVGDYTPSVTGTLKNWTIEMTYFVVTPINIHSTSSPDLFIPDRSDYFVTDSITIPVDSLLETIDVSVDIEHTYRGDLKVILLSPQGAQVVLHHQSYDSGDNINTTYSSMSHTGLASLSGVDINGDWYLAIRDYLLHDTGTLKNWAVNMTYIPTTLTKLYSKSSPDIHIPDDTDTQSITSTISIPANGLLETIDVSVDIEHTEASDLQVALVSPQGDQTILHDKTGSGISNISRTYSSMNHTDLASLVGAYINGDWMLSVGDYALLNTGTLKSWAVNMTYALVTVPGAPLNLTTVPKDNFMILSWDAPSDDGNSTIIGYTIDYLENSGISDWIRFQSGGGSSTDTSVSMDHLTPDTQYTFRVSAVNDAGSGRYSDNATATSAIIVPDAPIGLIATPDFNSITLDWDEPLSDGGSPITGYTVQYTTQGALWETIRNGTDVVVDDPSIRSIHVGNLIASTEYSFRVATVNIVGSSAYSVNTTIHTTAVGVPTAPTGLTTTPDFNSITLDWDEPSSYGTSPIIGYTVQHSAQGAPWETIRNGTDVVVDDPSIRSIHVDNLLAGTQHSFRVAAVNILGSSAYSTIATIHTTAASVPTAPTGLHTTPYADAITFTWNESPSDGGSPIIGYTVQYTTQGTSWETIRNGTDVAVDDPSIRSIHVDNLIANTEYSFRVATVNIVGSSVYSANATIHTLDPIAPVAPTGLTATPDFNSITLDWDEPLTDGGSSITGYTVQYTTQGAPWETIRNGTDVAVDNTRSMHVNNLIAGTEYSFRVAAVNIAGSSVYSANATIHTTTAIVPTAPINILPSPSLNSIFLYWDEPLSDGGSLITGYTVQHTTEGAPWETIRNGTDVDAGSYRYALLLYQQPGTQHTFRVAAVNIVGSSAYSANATVSTLDVAPLAPTGLIATPDFNSITLDWDEPTSAGGSPITGYTIQYTTQGVPWETIRNGTDVAVDDTRSIHVDNLIAGTQHTFRVAAVNIAGSSVYSANATVNTLDPIAPVAPAGLIATPDFNSITLDWDEPTSAGGSPITGYTIQYTTQGAPWETIRNGTDVVVDDPSIRSIHVGNLIASTEYSFRVAAVNIAGSSAYSVNTTIHTTAVGVPTAPTDLIATPDVNSITLDWNEPSSYGDSPIIGYTVQYTTQGAPWETIRNGTATDDDPSIRSIHVDNLLADTQHSFRVAAVNIVGSSAYSTIATIHTTAASVPTAPIGLLTISYINTIVITWNEPLTDGGSAIIGYTVQYTTQGTSWETIRNGTDVAVDDTRSIHVDNLIAGTQHSFRVAAVNIAGSSVYSANATVNTLDPIAPVAPAGLIATPDFNSITLDWDEPTSAGGSPITGYTVQYTAQGAPWETIRNGTDVAVDDTRSIHVDNLIAGTEYSFRVAAVNIAGSSVYSANATIHTTAAIVPTAPINLLPFPFFTAIILYWDEPLSDGGSPITGYTVQHSAQGAPWETIRNGTDVDDDADRRSIHPNKLIANTQYSFRVAAVNIAGSSVYSANATTNTLELTAPLVPTDLIATPDVNSITLTWNTPYHNGGSPITGYTVDYAVASSGTWQTQDSALVMNDTRETTISGLSEEYCLQPQSSRHQRYRSRWLL